MCLMQVFGNASLVADSSPRMTFKMDPNELVVGEDLWSSSSVMEGSHLTPLLAGVACVHDGAARGGLPAAGVQ
jgi:hypothetical protein